MQILQELINCITNNYIYFEVDFFYWHKKIGKN